MQAQESKVASNTISSTASKPKGPRLVIRVKITPEPPPPPPRSPITPRALGISAAVVALLTLGWVGITSLRDDDPADSMNVAQRAAPAQVSPLPSAASKSMSPPSAPADASVADIAPKDQSLEAESGSTPPAELAVPKPVNEVIPETPRSALQTITGTIRVAIRVDIDNAGNVTATHSKIPGPSRYFERLSRDAATQWKFTPSTSGDPRTMLVRFYYKRDGVTAEATTPD